MSAQSLQRGSDLSDKARKLISYLSDEVKEQGGEMYVKGKFISDDVGMSPKQIGQMMKQIQNTETDLTVEQWSYTGATTWRVAE